MHLMMESGFGASGLVFIAMERVGTIMYPPKTGHRVAYGPPRAPESGCLPSGPRAATAAKGSPFAESIPAGSTIIVPVWESIMVD